MSFEAMAWAVKQTPAGSKEKFVLLMLANYASNEKGECYPSLKEICDATMLSRDSVIRALKSLEDDGLVTVERQRIGKVNLPNTYTLNMQGVVAHSDHRGSSTEQGGSRKTPSRVVAESDPNLSEEPIKAKPREWTREKLDHLEAELRKASGLEDDPNPSLMDLSPIVGLIEAGHSLEVDILPFVRERCAGGFKPRSWRYFVVGIQDRAKSRAAIAQAAKPPAKEIDWLKWCQMFFRGRHWANGLGPNPDDPACEAPREIIEQARQEAAERQIA